MYSNNQWSFNPAVYQNIPYEQVDWASLAQQWIKMKETAPTTNQGPAPPPAPVISKPTDAPVPTPTAVSSQLSNDIEGGEAPMDMDTKDDEITIPPVAAAATTGPWNQWDNWQSQWGWGWSGNSGSVPLTENTPSATSNVDSKVKSTNNDSIAALNDVRNFPIVGNTATTTQVSSTFNYNNTGGTVIPPIIPKSNYAFNNAFPAGSKNSDNWHKAGKSSNRHAPQKSTPPEPFPVMDAAKKKQLPAWIREGLTKMEREKQKKMERERMVHEKHVTDQMKLDYNEPEPAPTPAYVEEPQSRDPPAAMPDYARRYSPEPSPAPSSRYQKRRSPSIPRQRSKEPQALRKTKDQIMEESMLKVRRILTEILLEATEKQVHLIAKEEHRRYRASASAPQIRKSNALTSLTGNLGLDVYDSEDNSSDGDRDRDDDIDSDEELKMVIEKKKRDFTLVEDEIERMIEDQETRERLISQRDSKDEGDIDDEDSADDEEDEPKTRSSRDKDIGGPMPHQRYPDHDRDRHSSGAIEPRAGDDDRNSSRRGGAPTIESKQLNGDSKSVSSSIPPPSTIPTAEDTERSKKEADSRSSSNGSGGHNTSRSRRTKRSQHRSRSSSSSSSSSASSSSSSSKHEGPSKSSSGDDRASSKSDASGNSKSSKRDKRRNRESRKKSDNAAKSTSSSKRTKRRSSEESDSGGGGDGGASARKRSTSKSRYYDGKSSSSSSYKRNARNDSAERKRHRRSPSYRRRSPNYHRSGSRREHEHSGKYKDSPSSSSSSRSRRRDDYSPESKRPRHRSSSRDSSRYKRR